MGTLKGDSGTVDFFGDNFWISGSGCFMAGIDIMTSSQIDDVIVVPSSTSSSEPDGWTFLIGEGNNAST